MQGWSCSLHFSVLHWYLQLLLNISVQKMVLVLPSTGTLLAGVQRFSKENPDCKWIMKNIVPQLYLSVENSFEP